MSPPNEESGVSSVTEVIGAAVVMVGSRSVFWRHGDRAQEGIGWRRRRSERRLQGKGGNDRGQQASLLQRHGGFGPDAHAASLGHSPAVGMVETFHYLLTLNSSVLNRGRDARQVSVSAQASLVDESKHPAIPLIGA